MGVVSEAKKFAGRIIRAKERKMEFEVLIFRKKCPVIFTPKS